MSSLPQTVRTLRLIYGTFFVGIFTLALVAVAIGNARMQMDLDSLTRHSPLTLLAWVYAACAAATVLVLKRKFTIEGKGPGDPADPDTEERSAPACARVRLGWVLRGSLVEGCGLFFAIALLLERHVFALFGVCLALALLAYLFPTEAKLLRAMHASQPKFPTGS